jgi:hypothetical protein
MICSLAAGAISALAATWRSSRLTNLSPGYSAITGLNSHIPGGHSRRMPRSLWSSRGWRCILGGHRHVCLIWFVGRIRTCKTCQGTWARTQRGWVTGSVLQQSKHREGLTRPDNMILRYCMESHRVGACSHSTWPHQRVHLSPNRTPFVPGRHLVPGLHAVVADLTNGSLRHLVGSHRRAGRGFGEVTG